MSAPARLLVSLGVVLAVGACGLNRPEIARAGDREIGEADLRHLVALHRAIADLVGGPCGQPVAGEPEAVACDRVALSVELRWRAIADYAGDHRLLPSDADVDRAVGQLEAQVGAETLDEALRAHDLGRGDLLAFVRKVLAIGEVRGRIAEDRIGREAIRALYRERATEFTIIEAAHILVETQAEADAIYRRVSAATEERFAAVARQVSIEPGASEDGGDLGRNVASTYAPEFASAAIALGPGEVSRPVETGFGWHVIYLVDKQVTPFEDAKAALLEPLADREFRAWLTERAAEMGIEVNPRFGRFIPATFAIEPVRSTDPDRDPDPPAS